MFPKSTKAFLDDLLDFLFLVMISFFAFMFIHIALVQSVDQRNDASKELIASVNALQEKLVNVRGVYENGGSPTLDTLTKEIDQKSIELPLRVSRPVSGSLTVVDGASVNPAGDLGEGTAPSPGQRR